MKLALGLSMAGLLTVAAVNCRAEGRALLIGVGQYKGHPDLRLDGPPNDVAKLQEELPKWGFTDIVPLVDSKATGAAIREALKALAKRIRPGDQVFVFFSGHGTSAFDPKWAKVCSDVDSGCLIPHDVENGDEAAVLRSLILGRRDIRPALLDMEKQNPAGIFVAFDACYAQNSAKSVQGGAKLAKEAPLSAFIRKSSAAKGSALDSLEDLDPSTYARPNESRHDSGFPYERVIYLSASAKDERAFDIPEWKLKEQPTIDKRPHGRFTNAMLIGMSGAADLDRDQTISYRELHQFTIQQLRGGQNPQVQAKSAAVLEGPAFGSNRKFERAGGSTPNRGNTTVGVLLRDSAAGIREKIAELKASGIELVTTAPDFVIEAAPGGWSLALDNGLEVRRYSREDLPSLLARLKAEPSVRKLMNWKFETPAAKVELSFGPEGRGVHFIDDLVEFRMSASKPMYFLLVNVNTAGGISVIYPSKYQPSAKVQKMLSRAKLEDPAGAEYMKLFAFETEASPGELNRFATDDPFPAASAAFTELLSTIEKASNAAEAGLVFYSARKPAPQQ